MSFVLIKHSSDAFGSSSPNVSMLSLKIPGQLAKFFAVLRFKTSENKRALHFWDAKVNCIFLFALFSLFTSSIIFLPAAYQFEQGSQKWSVFHCRIYSLTSKEINPSLTWSISLAFGGGKWWKIVVGHPMFWWYIALRIPHKSPSAVFLLVLLPTITNLCLFFTCTVPSRPKLEVSIRLWILTHIQGE